MNRREFLNTAAAAAAAGAVRGATPPRPNVLFILADDLGYGDLSCYGRPDYKTPVLDRVAREGVRFTDAYAAAPICTPTRCAFHTGRYPHRLEIGLEEPLLDNNMQLGIPPDHPTLASLLKAKDYETALIGKWHLGNLEQFGPNRHGFDEFYGINGSSADYFTHQNTVGRFDLWENLRPSRDEGYLTDLFTARAVRYLSRKHTRPFFLCLQYNAPHWPWDGPGDKEADHRHPLNGRRMLAAGGSQAVFAEMVKSMDAGIGEVLKTLRAADLERNTLLIFTSDNGGERYSYNWPFSFQKGNCFEGGLRVPTMVRWPGAVPPGRVTNQAAITMDWAATILGVTGVQPDPAYPLDGENLIDVCTGAGPVYDRTLFWRNQFHDAARSGKWKYLREGGNEHLFDLSQDPGEKTERRLAHAEVFQRLRTQFREWNAQMLPRPR
jgi:arylsulfatase A-like enzyme